jgi:hypothetical protein
MDQFDRWINEDPNGGGVPVQSIDFWMTVVFVAMVVIFLVICLQKKK